MEKKVIKILFVLGLVLISLLQGCTEKSKDITLDRIAVKSLPEKTTYYVNENLDITGLVVEGTYSDGSKRIETITIGAITGFDSSIAAVEILKINIDGKTASFEINIENKPMTVTLRFNAYEVGYNDIETRLLTKFNYAVVSMRTDAIELDNAETDYKEGDNIIGITPDMLNYGKPIVVTGVAINAKFLRVAVPRQAMVATYVDLTKYNLAENAGDIIDLEDVILKHRKDYALNVVITREDFILAGYSEERANGIKDIYVTGPFNGWNTKDSKYKMVEDTATGIFSYEFTGLGVTDKFEYKFCNDGSWANGGGMPELFADNFGADGIFWDKNTERHYNNDGIWANAGGSNGFATIVGRPLSRTEAEITGFIPQQVENDTGVTHEIIIKMPYMLITDDIAFNKTVVTAEYTYMDGMPVPMVNIVSKEILPTNIITYAYDKEQAKWRTGVLINGTFFLANRISFAAIPEGESERLIKVKFTVTDKYGTIFTERFIVTQKKLI